MRVAGDETWRRRVSLRRAWRRYMGGACCGGSGRHGATVVALATTNHPRAIDKWGRGGHVRRRMVCVGGYSHRTMVGRLS
eukprot:COSAG01_NODE_19431_length_1009_cov_22.574910_2_plen_80_part_00